MMKRVISRAVAGMAMSAVLLMALKGQVASQERRGAETACPGGTEVGSLGISGLDCVGECTLTVRPDGSERSWFFSAEPKVFSLEAGGPAEGILRPGDFIVAVDGIPITTRTGGERYANILPGEAVRIRFRRDGRVGEATISAAAACRESPSVAGTVSRAQPPPPPPARPSVGERVVVAPRVRVATGGELGVAKPVGESEKLSTVFAVGGAEFPLGAAPSGQLGIGYSCSKCGVRTDEETGESTWFFSSPLEVTAVTLGGPAQRAGIQRGDLIKAIQGYDIGSEEGGREYSRLTPGREVWLTVVKRNGSEVQVSVVPEETLIVGVSGGDEGVVAGGVAQAVRPAAPAQPAVPDPAVVGGEAGGIAPPPDLPLRYSGTVEGIEVEVRGDPVMVSEVKGARTLYISTDGLWIRIIVPRRTPGETGGEASIRR